MHRKQNIMRQSALATMCTASLLAISLSPAVAERGTYGELRGSIIEQVPYSSASINLGLDHMTTGTTTGTVATGFFGSVAIPFSNISRKADWNRVSAKGISFSKDQCFTPNCNLRLAGLEGLTDNKKKSFFELMQQINKGANTAIKYSSDSAIYNKPDYWASANETIGRGQGDCEDFAILKHAMLVKAGVPGKSLSLVILKDTKRKLYHAVLAVSTNKGHFILDNVFDRVYLDRDMPQYQAMFSFSLNKSWLHGEPELPYRNKPLEVALNTIVPGESFATVNDLSSQNTTIFDDIRPAIIRYSERWKFKIKHKQL